ncbi:unnamed protein product [Heterotrigona itama]|uniref:F-box domain-containing protein n=1 Tax=Heterotrigona itama TaxID=395501 RepID=A0A6V7GX76_9HYME|nr:unnamed protein product [Heterotrigona itama]
MIFPVEIWERIFLYVDPPTLVNMRIICKCWKDIIDKMLQQSAQWYKLCKNKIPEEFWSTLCETLNSKKFYTNFHEIYDVQFWIAMYKLWIKCKNMTKCDTQSKCVKLIDNPTEYITCTDTSENLLAIGTSEGLIYLYYLPNLQTCEYVINHMEYVHSIKLLRDETNIVCLCCSINDHISFWDVKTLKLLSITHGKFIWYGLRNTIYKYICIHQSN